MSQALPLPLARRLDGWFLSGTPKTPRQRRQDLRMLALRDLRERGGLTHGATGERIRRPLVHVSLPPERGSIRTHVASYCEPCAAHSRPRLHRRPIETGGTS